LKGKPIQEWLPVRGVIVRGHGVASKGSEHYSEGTIAMQIPFFRARGLDLTPYYPATLNISIFPRKFRVKNAEYRFEKVDWTPNHPPEDFSFSRCIMVYGGENHEGWIYYPHPETKIRHQHNDSLVEVIARRVAGISYGDEIEIRINLSEIDVQ
jgi:hypothetical protein